MELKIEARFILRLLLTSLLMLYGSAGVAGQTPGSDMGDTLVDDEDVNGRERSGVRFTLDLVSSVEDDRGGECFGTALQDALKSQIKTQLVAALQEDCKCQPPTSLVDNDKLECVTDSGSLVRYSGQISYWSSVTYSVKQLAEFIESWRASIQVEGKDGGFTFNKLDFKFTFNITSSQVDYGGSGDGAGVEVVEFGSADITTIDLGGPDEDVEEAEKDAVKVSELEGESGEPRSRVVGLVSVILCTALAIAACFV